jgi:hypothetical protein
MTSSRRELEGRAGFDRASFEPCDEDDDLPAARGRRRLPFSSDNSIQTGAWSPARAPPAQLALFHAHGRTGAHRGAAGGDQPARRGHPGMTPGDEASGHVLGAGSATSHRSSQLAVSFTS